MSDINKIVSQKRDYLQTQMVKRTGYHVVLQLYIYHFKVNYSNVVRYFQSCFLKSIVSFVMVSIMVLSLVSGEILNLLWAIRIIQFGANYHYWLMPKADNIHVGYIHRPETTLSARSLKNSLCIADACSVSVKYSFEVIWWSNDEGSCFISM